MPNGGASFSNVRFLHGKTALIVDLLRIGKKNVDIRRSSSGNFGQRRPFGIREIADDDMFAASSDFGILLLDAQLV